MNPAANKAYMRSRHARLEASGICTHCGKSPARPNRKTCEACGRKNSEHSSRRQKRLRKANAALHVCVVCNAREAMPSRRWCAVCSERHTEYAAMARARQRSSQDAA